MRIFIWIIFLLWGCTTAPVSPPPPPPKVPEYTKVPHPQGTDVADLEAMFRSETAPQDPEFIGNCDRDYLHLKSLTQSKEELMLGVRELVRRDPVVYHWCFYGKLLKLEEEMKKDLYVDERQKSVLTVYEFLVPVSRAFNVEYHDSRYLRWATAKYKRLSEWIFYRRLDLTPEGTAELVESTNPFGLWRNSDSGTPILEKYGMVAAPVSVPDTVSVPVAESVSIPVSESVSETGQAPVSAAPQAPQTAPVPEPKEEPLPTPK